MKKQKWTKIDDSKVRHYWKCPECGEEAILEPSFYDDAGIPICTGTNMNCEGMDMCYVRTEILI